MTNEQINIAIAEACGWKPTTDGGICWDCNGSPIVTPPDYCADLNAMHEAEKCLNEDQKADFCEQLAQVIGAPWLSNNSFDQWLIAHASARQRAEAFLKTIGKWEVES